MGRARGGWLVGGTAVVAGGLVALALATSGTGVAGLQAALRATARLSLALFVPTFAASALATLWRRAPTRWMMRYRRFLGLSFAASHLVHLGAIAALARTRGEAFPTAGALAGPGGLAYLLLFAMVATSFDRAERWLGRRRWRALHLTGMYALWLVFTVTYARRTAREPLYALALAALLGALALRGAAWLRRRRTRAARSPGAGAGGRGGARLPG